MSQAKSDFEELIYLDTTYREAVLPKVPSTPVVDSAPESTRGQMLEQFDKDEDGELSLEEVSVV